MPIPAQTPKVEVARVPPPPEPETRIEYVPFEKTVIEYEDVKEIEKVPRVRTIIEYEEVEKIKKVPREKKVTDYKAIEYITEYKPKITHEK